ncbi:hypothetical protein [Flavihumibacter petaseus]|uniref:Extracellular endo-alpha-(1->5)-L-arabinanase C-terminal domain-containing protein n=1 Tax=Flavihumibacter petaseus NBRC 106054 TaxID=1220578 RepID=A0A0E9MV31_9BACT|nr:hypothetical protein [Flavihumibacter petaseus]GAO41419.1 hypothetical protein FPE01S_01_04310 [Flavihumibacter petaseus NBRC 106054]
MKQLVMAATLLLYLVPIVSCNKKEEGPAFATEGIWTGKLGSGNDVPDQPFQIRVKPRGLLERVNGGGEVRGIGSWKVTGNEFTAHYDFIESNGRISLKGNLNKENLQLAGTWGSGDAFTGGGSWFASKFIEQ